MKPLLFALCVVFACCGQSAQKFVWQPSPGHTQIPIWPGAAPDPQQVAGPEFAKSSGKNDLIAGKQVVEIDNVYPANDDRLFAKGKEYRRCGRRFSWRRLSDSGHRP